MCTGAQQNVCTGGLQGRVQAGNWVHYHHIQAQLSAGIPRGSGPSLHSEVGELGSSIYLASHTVASRTLSPASSCFSTPVPGRWCKCHLPVGQQVQRRETDPLGVKTRGQAPSSKCHAPSPSRVPSKSIVYDDVILGTRTRPV